MSRLDIHSSFLCPLRSCLWLPSLRLLPHEHRERQKGTMKKKAFLFSMTARSRAHQILPVSLPSRASLLLLLSYFSAIVSLILLGHRQDRNSAPAHWESSIS